MIYLGRSQSSLIKMPVMIKHRGWYLKPWSQWTVLFHFFIRQFHVCIIITMFSYRKLSELKYWDDTQKARIHVCISRHKTPLSKQINNDLLKVAQGGN